MKREVIQDFLNLPGIAGVALMDGRSRPYFCGLDQTLNFQQKEALAQGILQVIETIPEGFEAFEFQFTDHQVHLYKLDRGIVLLVLTQHGLVYADYLGTVKQLKAVLQADTPNAIATFRLLAGTVTLTGFNYRQPSADTARTIAPDSEAIVGSLTATNPAVVLDTSVNVPVADLKAAIEALNHLSQFTTHYLGTHVIANYWKATRPPGDWLEKFQIDRAAQFSFSELPPQETLIPLASQEQQWLQAWVAAFIKRCSQVVRDFPAIVTQTALNEQQKALLLPLKDGDARVRGEGEER